MAEASLGSCAPPQRCAGTRRVPRLRRPDRGAAAAGGGGLGRGALAEVHRRPPGTAGAAGPQAAPLRERRGSAPRAVRRPGALGLRQVDPPQRARGRLRRVPCHRAWPRAAGRAAPRTPLPPAGRPRAPRRPPPAAPHGARVRGVLRPAAHALVHVARGARGARGARDRRARARRRGGLARGRRGEPRHLGWRAAPAQHRHGAGDGPERAAPRRAHLRAGRPPRLRARRAAALRGGRRPHRDDEHPPAVVAGRAPPRPRAAARGRDRRVARLRRACSEVLRAHRVPVPARRQHR
mmetsp:Transcript_6253/g.21977  ORF Transcript_6253/g.21977 Transcript_6253/m.21977 type:complete len:294 (+) Transcript_6253:69-950(+)